MVEKKFSIIALIVFTGLAIIALYHNISPYLTPSELIGKDEAENVQVVGKIVSVNGNTFQLSDGETSITVIYNGSIQQYDTEVVVVGNWDGKVLQATEVLQKCHTEYKGG
ncbi:cytochrome c maturation protein CcmE domain-containing protein [Archaeoglobus sp.]